VLGLFVLYYVTVRRGGAEVATVATIPPREVCCGTLDETAKDVIVVFCLTTGCFSFVVVDPFTLVVEVYSMVLVSAATLMRPTVEF